MATGELLKNKTVAALAKKYNRTIAQLSIRYILQHGVLPRPKSTTPERIAQNRNVDFEIAEADMNQLNSLKNTIEVMHGPPRK